MARFYGPVGYAGDTVETSPGVYEEVPVEFISSGDIVRNTGRRAEGDKVNDDISLGNSISIVADAYAREHFYAIRYVKWRGVSWEVTGVDVEHPRLILRLGGVYNGNTA